MFLAILLFLHATDGCTSSWKFTISLRLTNPSRLCKASTRTIEMHYAISCRCCFIGDATVGCVLLFEGSSSKFFSSGSSLRVYSCKGQGDIALGLQRSLSDWYKSLLFLMVSDDQPVHSSTRVYERKILSLSALVWKLYIWPTTIPLGILEV